MTDSSGSRWPKVYRAQPDVPAIPARKRTPLHMRPGFWLCLFLAACLFCMSFNPSL